MNAQHHYFHPGPQDCRSYRQCHDRAYGVVAAVPTPPDAPDVEAVRWWLIERGYISTANVLTAVIDAERSAPTPPDAPLATTCPTCGSPVGRLEAAVIELRLAAVPTPPDAPTYPNVPAFDHGENCLIWGDRGPCNCKSPVPPDMTKKTGLL